MLCWRRAVPKGPRTQAKTDGFDLSLQLHLESDRERSWYHGNGAIIGASSQQSKSRLIA